MIGPCGAGQNPPSNCDVVASDLKHSIVPILPIRLRHPFTRPSPDSVLGKNSLFKLGIG